MSPDDERPIRTIEPSQHLRETLRDIHQGRTASILTKKDREFLWDGPNGYSDQKTRDIRYRIRQRTKDGIKDLELLYHLLQPQDREKIFQDLSEERREVLETATAFFYLGSKHANIEEDLEEFLSNVFQRVEEYGAPDEVVTVDVDIDVNKRDGDIEAVQERIKSGDATIEDLDYLIKHQELGPIFDYLSGGKTIKMDYSNGDFNKVKFDIDSLSKYLQTGSVSDSAQSLSPVTQK